jgi:hypothetical protein
MSVEKGHALSAKDKPAHAALLSKTDAGPNTHTATHSTGAGAGKRALQYGEVQFESFAYMLSLLQPTPQDRYGHASRPRMPACLLLPPTFAAAASALLVLVRFYDLGSGTGRAVVAAALLFSFQTPPVGYPPRRAAPLALPLPYSQRHR